MGMNTESVHSAIDQIEKEYRKKTLLKEGLVRTDTERRSTEQCISSRSVPVENIDRYFHPIVASEIVEDLLSCERQKILSGLKAESNISESINDDVVSDVLKAIGSISVPTVLYLPDSAELRTALERLDADETIGTQYDVAVSWFQPGIFDSNYGFLLSGGVYVSQKVQRDLLHVSQSSEVDLSEEHLENRVITSTRRVRGGKVEFEFQTRFSAPQKIDDRSKILTLELPDTM
ncbi:hypothetical protein [Haloferax sp. Atlit-19N]|uniref:hypothetical protein n=1 Tax=Haloferax sp. Atlit-19N TaxID=2077201 RepID=UPI0011C02E95|nr:hypothetical protein [Haloferax sp. Atlit-19N]